MEFFNTNGGDYMNFEFSDNCGEFEMSNSNTVLPKNELIKLKEKKSSAIDFDFYGLEFYIVSKKFLALCDSLNISYSSEQCTIVFKENKFEEFYFFAPTICHSIIDESKSIFEVDEFSTSENQKKYSLIEKFVPIENIQQNLLYCTDIEKVVCSELFKSHAEKTLKNIRFTEIESYIHDPFHKYSGKFGNL